MAVFRKYFCISIAVANLAFGATNAMVTQVQQNYNQDTTLNIDIDLNGTPNGQQGFISCNAAQSDCYTGAIFSKYDTLTLGNNATLTINLTARGNYSSWAAVFFRGEGGKTYTINGGTFALNLISLPEPVGAPQPVEGVFITRRQNSNLPSQFVFNSDVIVTATENFYITRGIFNVNDGKGGYRFNKNTYIDVSHMQESKGWHGSGVKYKSITSVSGDGYFYVNYDPQNKTTINRDNIVQLKGDIAVEKQSTNQSEVIIHLTNPQSFFQGRFSLQGAANAELLLDRGGKWILTADSAVRTLDANNNPHDLENQYGNHEKIAAIDFTQTTDNGVGSRLTSDDPFKRRLLDVNILLKGSSGVFRLMADVPQGQTDSVRVNQLTGTHYVQLFQNGKRLSFDVAGKNMIVAQAANAANGDFVGLITIAGLYNYDPVLTRQATAGGGANWLLTGITYTPNQTAKTLFNVLSTPYKIFRLHADNINHRIEDLLYPPTKFGAWAKMYGGGIYQRNDFDRKDSTADWFFAFQGGFDYGETSGDTRYFFGGSLDYLQTFGNDAGYNGNVSSFGFGAYGGYIQDDELFIDAKLKYVFSAFRNNLYQAQDSVDFYGSIFLANFRLGYSFYPFRNARTKTIQTCKKSGGKLFCRNGKSKGYVKDPRFHIQPYVSITPGIISGHSLNFIDKVSNYNVLGKLDLSPSLITSVGIMGIKRYEYDTYNVQAKTFLSYSYDINLGGKITLIDNANIPLFNLHKNGDHRITLGIGSDVLFFNDSLKVYGEFRTEILGRLNTYWLFSGGVRYKFGQPAEKRKGTLSHRPKSAAKPQSRRSKLAPYQHKEDEANKTFNRQNHFREMEGGTIRSR